MTKFFNKSKRPYYGATVGTFSTFLVQNTFSGKIWICHTNLGITNDLIPRKRQDRWTEGDTSGMTDKAYFIGPVPNNQ